MISSSNRHNLPEVAIVGRPNVGKSTLFNRLVGRRRSITDATPGVTRDRLEAEVTLLGNMVRLVDTGGYLSGEEGLSARVSEVSRSALDSADVVLLVVDVTGLTPEDEELIELVRRFSQKVVLVVNKVDNEMREADVWDYHALGFPRVVPVSAEHKLNLDELRRAVVELLPAETLSTEKEEAEEVHVAILGKPNTGKSTLLNRLVGESRSLVSDAPGTTRDVVDGSFVHKGTRYVVTDSAGIRRKSSVRDSVEFYSVSRAIGTVEDADIVLLLVDVQEGITDQDKKIAALILKRLKPVVLVFNKWDKMRQIPNADNAVTDRARFLFPLLDFAPIVLVSAQDGDGVPNLLSTIRKVWRQCHTKISTPQLNKSIQEWTEAYSPPHNGKTWYKPRYMTQIGTHPLRFLLFVNRKHGFPDTWVSYVKNNLRNHYGISNVPLSVELRES